jgi:hypothetical protein
MTMEQKIIKTDGAEDHQDKGGSAGAGEAAGKRGAGLPDHGL